MRIYKKRWIQSGIALICSLAIVLSVFPVLADNDEIKSLEDQSSSLESELQGINEDILALSDEISTTEMQVEMLNGEIARTSDELKEAKANEEKQYEDMKARIKYMYEHGNATLLELLFSAEDMSDFLNKADFIENLSEYDRNALNELKDIHQQIEDEQNTLQTQQDSLTELEDQLQTQQTALQAKADATSTNLADVQSRLQKAKEEEAARIAAEAAARKKAEEELNIKGIADVRRQISAKCDAFASLEEIYLKIRQELQLTEEMTKKLIELEKYIDTKLCVPRRKIVELFNYSLALGKDTYIVSDMYYCRKDLEELLNRCGIKGIQPDNIWVSCERKRDKITGSMWKMFADSVIKGRKCIHIGDNVKGDVKNPTYFGIETVYVMSGRDMLLNSSVRELASDIITAEDSVCAGLFVSEVFNNPYALCKSKGKLVFTDSEVYGYSVYGPMITKFLIWLYCNSHKDSIDTLLFFARDGYFLENDYREMMKLLGDVNSQRTEYLPISRRLIYLASAEDEEDFRRIVAFPYVGTFRDYMLSRFNINVTDKSERYNDKQVNAVGDADRLMEWIEPYRQDIEKEISLEKRNYIKYLEKHGLFDRERTFGTVDLGYYGTNQFYLQKLLKRKMEGYCVYACLSQNNVFINEISMKGCFQQDDDPAAERSLIKKKNMYVETFLTAPYGMIRYIDENMNMVCEPDKKSQKNFQIKEKVNEGVLRYLADYVSLFDRNAIMKINNMIEEKLFYNILNGMADISKEILEGFYFDNDFIGGREIGIEA